MTQEDESLARFRKRASELESSSINWSHAHNRAWLEELINHNWPSGWGDDLQVLIYGDFRPPDSDAVDEHLGITVFSEDLSKQENIIIRNALCVVKAKLSIDDRSVESIVDAFARLNVFLGAWTLASRGNVRFGWWCHLVHGNVAGTIEDFEIGKISNVASRLCDLPDRVRQKVEAALYWMRATPATLSSHTQILAFKVFTDYWNAFECLVDAVHILRPEQKVSNAVKQQRIDNYLEHCGGHPSVQQIDELYHSVVSTGFVGKAGYALRECFGNAAYDYIHECFERPDKSNRFYQIRNSINHGDINAENPEEKLRIESRQDALQEMLMQMFTRVLDR